MSQENIPMYPEKLPTPEVDNLPERLGFVENEQLQAMKAQIIAASLAGDYETARALGTAYRTQGEVYVEALEGSDYVHAQIGLLVAIALIKRDGGNIEGSLVELDDARVYADNVGLDDVVSMVSAEQDRLNPAGPIS